ncbi:fam-c protein [Plasmodium chabaudi adami]|uniref:Fam-c protein n=1 Tax=Plasmodium chabaudi adami TaxID=5826 RepID=A0A1C6WAV3_PLACE|nr:fam-c protein [Plasmodium chabaudi adami]
MNKRIFSLVCTALYALLAVSIHCSDQKAYDVGNKSICGTNEINKSNEKNSIESKFEIQLKNNNPKYDEEDDKGFNCFNIFKRNKKNKRTKTTPYSKVPLTHLYNQITEAPSSNNEPLPMASLQIQKTLRAFSTKNPYNSKMLSLSKGLSSGDQISDANELCTLVASMLRNSTLNIDPKYINNLFTLPYDKKSEGEQLSNNNESVLKEPFMVGNNKHAFFKNGSEALKLLSRFKENLDNDPSKLKLSE